MVEVRISGRTKGTMSSLPGSQPVEDYGRFGPGAGLPKEPGARAVSAERGYRAGLEDAFLFPLVAVAVALKALAFGLLAVLVRILDYSFPILLELVRIPLFLARAAGDGVIAVAAAVIGWLPIPQQQRMHWREFLRQLWARLRAIINYKAFEQAVHRVFEHGMEWVFRRCRNLTPSQALCVIIAAMLWLPVSLVMATTIHALLLAYALVLPAWMQLLHPFATIIAKSKLLVLPVYPAAWPQAKRHPLVQGLASGYRNLVSLFLVRKAGYRFRQTENAIAGISDRIERGATAIGLEAPFSAVGGRLHRVAVRANSLRNALANTFERFTGAQLLGPLMQDCADLARPRRSNKDKTSDKLSEAIERWSVKFSAEYYEAKDRAKGAGDKP
jgi:hypothetical protein